MIKEIEKLTELRKQREGVVKQWEQDIEELRQDRKEGKKRLGSLG
jgi:hypothetical protein